MDEDLSDVGLNALEAMEAEDAQDTSEPDNTGEDDKDTSETEDTSEDTGDKENETTQDSSSDEENGEGEDGSDKEPTGDDTEDEKYDVEEDEKELSDDEFEEMAKKRGYSKAPNEEEKKQAEARENALLAQMDKLVARPKEVDEDVWNDLPQENKIIYNTLPYITAVGKDGEVKIKTPDQLPDDFTFASKKDEVKFYNELQAQELKATQMANALESRRQRGERAQAQRNEARNVINQIEALQKSGELPTPKAKNGTKEFDTDEAVVLINKVLNYRAELAEKRNVNLPIRESLLLYKAEHPEEFTKKEAKGDTERRNIAKKVAGNSKSTGTAVNKDNDNKPQYYRVGMSTEDVLDRILDDME